MSIAQPSPRLQIPESLRRQLDAFRRRVWAVKVVEAGAAAACGVLACYLATFAADRLGDTPLGARLALAGLAALAILTVPVAVHRWVWRRRRPDQLARLLAWKHPRVGDRLLGVIELARDDSEQGRSRRLVEAAIAQVADDAAGRDFRDAVPNPRHKLWIGALALPAALAVALAILCPDAARNALLRLAAPWAGTPRYTFAMLEPVPAKLVVPHGEAATFAVALAERTAWHPVKAEARVGDRPPMTAVLRDNRYEFAIPPLVAPTRLTIGVGDATRVVAVEPMLRPELTAVAARVTLPEYLGRPGEAAKDARGGSITLVRGSRARVEATANRELAAAWVDEAPVKPAGSTILGAKVPVDGPGEVRLRWVDRFGLSGPAPLALKVNGRDDEAPSVSVEGLPRQKVVLDSELLNFKVRAVDDFGVRRVGVEWQGLDKKAPSGGSTGEQVLAPGGPDKESLEVAGAFSAKSAGIEPQPIALRVFVEDYLPGRPRVTSAPFILYVLTPEQHAIWLTEQLSKWHRQALEVRDRELVLHEGNKQLRDMDPADLDRPDVRKRIESQAAGELANGRRLNGLVNHGEDLVKQAMRNPEFGVGHLERWAEMLQVLKDAAQAPQGLAQAQSNNAPRAGMDRSNGQARPTTDPPPGAPKPPTAIPTVTDRESSQAGPDGKEAPPAPGSPPKTPRLTLPQTVLTHSGGKPAEPPPPAPPMDAAVNAQRDLLAEFEKVADELNKVLANLEGSTLVKRLKAASRVQAQVATRIGDQVADGFGLKLASRPQPPSPAPLERVVVVNMNGPVAPPAAPKPATEPKSKPTPEREAKPTPLLDELAAQEAKGSQAVSTIMDDLAAYFERRRYVRFQAVLDEMKQKDVIGALRTLGDDLKREQGLSIAQAEFWADTLDRWADDLVDPANCGACPGSKSKSSLPPSIILEVMQILEGEVNLREETRVAEQARPALAAADVAKGGRKLSNAQMGLHDRVVRVLERIVDLPDAQAEFGYEIDLLTQVADVMDEAAGILAKPETGAPAIAAETEAIELLLKSKRINPKGGGGGGASPGGGGTGTTRDSALALVGQGVNAKEVRVDLGTPQASGEAGPALPEEFRAGLDQYFNKLERAPANR